MRGKQISLPLAACLAAFLGLASSAGANVCGTTSLGTYNWVASGRLTRSNNCFGGSGFRCYPAQDTSWSLEQTSPGCDPTVGSCGVNIHAYATIPGLRDMVVEDGLGGSITPFVFWYPCAGAGCTRDGICGLDGFGGRINFDNLDTWLERGLSCAQARALTLSVKIQVCPTACTSSVTIDIPSPDLAQALGCPVPPPPPCTEPSGQASGASGSSCPLCEPVAGSGGGGGCSVAKSGGGPSCEPPGGGPGAKPRYAAGGVGGDGLPGATAWRTILGRFWSHDYAERIVVDPDNTHVWLLTRYGSFREFSNLASGSGLRLYQNRAPSDEFRKLYFDTATSGWQLQTLDGRTDFFRPDGLWDKTVFAADPTHPTQGTYAGSELTSVSFPDGRSESFTYTGGKLASITEVAVAGSGTPSRTWTYTWSGDTLAEILRPDGRKWEFTYDPGRPGYLTQVRLVATDLSGRVEAAFEYESGTNNVAKSWSGDPSFTGANAANKVTYSYTNPTRPTQAVVTRTLSATFNQVTTINIARDTVSIKPKLTSIQGSCPTCGLSPTTSFAYTGSNPLLPSSMTDAKNTRTDYTYSADGRLLTKTEAANVPSLTRATTYTYDTNFPSLVTRVEVPSTSGGSNKRRTDSAFDATTGVLNARTLTGFEAGVAFTHTTTFAHNASGEVLTIDPPGFGTTDQTSFTYNLAGRNGHVADSRTDPLVGTTTFGYDGLNRRTSAIDVNGVETLTGFDSLNRVTEVRQKGTLPADDLVTSYTYNAFGDLFCTKLPRSNGIEYLYDAAGRLKETIRGTAVAAPTSTSCLDVALPRERAAYQLDGAGNRVEESLERWTGSAWVSDSKTTYEFTCHLDKVTLGAGSSTTSVTEYCYDLNDNLEKVWDANHPKGSNPNPTQLYAYDALNRLTSVTVGPGTGTVAATSYAYDVQDHLASVTDAESNVTTYTTSDRDLLTQQVSPVSGTTTHAYNEHGELLTTTDARAIVTMRTVDAADRVTQETFGPAGSPDPTLTTTYAYGSTPGQFNVGRLTGITRNSQTIAYRYDRFGRVLQDGALTYEVDKNGNRTRTTYPGGVAAIATHDFADREATLSVDSGGTQPLVTSASYKALGPLAALSFANGLSETRLFDPRYFPDRIQAGALLDWDYAVDATGNPTAITGLIASTPYSASFAYHDNLYFLTQGNGPWGNRTWTYDKIGNRLSFAKSSEPTLSYAYAGTGHNPKLSTVTPAPGRGSGAWSYVYDAAGNQTQIQESNNEGPLQTTFYDVAADSRMSALRTDTGPSRTDFLYDGRGFLREADLTVTPPGDNIRVTPVYSSDGVLMARTEERQWTSATTGGDGEDLVATVLMADTTQIFYFAGRPVAQLTTGPELLYLTTDHLGTPILATDTTGGAVWAGGVEPFGATWTAGPDNPDVSPSTSGGLSSTTEAAISRLSSEEVFLRYPGQWVSDAFRITGTQQDFYYNLYRWYDESSSRYTQPDPLGVVDAHAFSPSTPTENPVRQLFGYAEMNPVVRFDPFGLKSRVCCRGIPVTLNIFKHCYIEMERDNKSQTCGLIGGLFSLTPGRGEIIPENGFDKGGQCGDWNESCGADECVKRQAGSYPNPSEYRLIRGPNSNSFAGGIARKCGLGPPNVAGTWQTPGWGDPPAGPKPGRVQIPVACFQ
jgi:RHS repeat-associated protein